MDDGEAGRSWEEAKQRFPTGTLVTGTVSQQHPFGIFVDLGDPIALGLVQITEFRDQGRMTPDLYPSVGEARRSGPSCSATRTPIEDRSGWV